MGLLKQSVVFASIVLLYSFIYEKRPFKNSNCFHEKQIDDIYDYVIVGGGTSGSVVASRLSEDPESTVLLLEAGGHYEDSAMMAIPIQWVLLQDSEYLWECDTEEQSGALYGLLRRRGTLGRGRVLGGTGVINGMQYTRGSRHDFDKWADSGCTGWSFKDVLPYFLKSEDIQIEELRSSKYHNEGEPISVSGGGVTPLSEVFMQAGRELGYNITDYNGEDPIGFNPIQMTVRNGIRSSTGKEFLGNKCNQKNLHVSLNSMTTKINIQNKAAKGVYFIKNGKKHYVKARKEVILSAGAMNSPQLLMLSGIGPKEDLEKLNIPVIADLPVGRNLQDHQCAFFYSKINKPISITSELLNSWWTNIQYELFGKGPMSISSTEGSGFFYSDSAKQNNSFPDIQFMIYSHLHSINGFGLEENIASEVLAKPTDHGFTVSISVSHPKSIGYVKLRSDDPFDTVILDPKYLTDKRDIPEYINGIRIWEQYVQTPTMKALGVNIDDMKFSFCAQHEFRSDEYWECYVRHLAIGAYHHTGTCKMGAKDDPTSVVDPELRVKGIIGLRVVDTSIIPNITSGNTMAPAIMVGEKASDMIRGKYTVGHLKRFVKNK